MIFITGEFVNNFVVLLLCSSNYGFVKVTI
jgi:hypothetical protein